MVWFSPTVKVVCRNNYDFLPINNDFVKHWCHNCHLSNIILQPRTSTVQISITLNYVSPFLMTK